MERREQMVDPRNDLTARMNMYFIDWDGRPAVARGDTEEAFAVIVPGGNWRPVDYFDVVHTGRYLSEKFWRNYFDGEYGPLVLSRISWSEPVPWKPKTDTYFFNWNGRPAVVKGAEAFAVTKPGGAWRRVKLHNVCYVGFPTDEMLWRHYNEREFGPLDLSKIPWSQPKLQGGWGWFRSR
jgi:hypothetical protein